MIPFILGAIIGSFLNVIIIRTPQGLSIVSPRSHCTSCKATIPFYFNIPVISYIILRGKCFYCQEKISAQYPAVELLTGLIFMVSFLNASIDEAILFSLCSCILIIIGFIDFRYYLIPIYLIILLYIILIPKIILGNIPSLEFIFGGIAVCSYLCLCSAIIAIRKKTLSVVGMGDILLAFFMGAWFGAIDGIICLFIASIVGILFIIMTNNKKEKIPFGLCLTISFIMISILNLYGYTLIKF